MKQIKKMLALLLGAVLLIGLLPAAALAADDDPITRLDLVMAIYNSPAFGLSGKTSSNKTPFTDLDGLTDEQINAFAVLREAGLMSGNADGTAAPSAIVDRLSAVVLMHRAAGGAGSGGAVTPPYKDIPEDPPIFKDIFSDLYGLGILTDDDMDEDGNFRPDESVTEAQMNAWLKAFAKEDEGPAPSDPAPKELTKQGLAEDLHDLGLFQGMDDTGKNFALDLTATRLEGLAMLIRILGKEDEAFAGSWSHPFQDVPNWADGYVGYAYDNRLAAGISGTEYGVGGITVNMYLTFVLRALGYSDVEGDFSWKDPYDLAAKVGILPSSVDRESFLRGDMVVISAAALGATLKDSELTLADKLIEEGVFTQEQYDAATLIHRVRTEWA